MAPDGSLPIRTKQLSPADDSSTIIDVVLARAFTRPSNSIVRSPSGTGGHIAFRVAIRRARFIHSSSRLLSERVCRRLAVRFVARGQSDANAGPRLRGISGIKVERKEPRSLARLTGIIIGVGLGVRQRHELFIRIQVIILVYVIRTSAR